MKEDGNKEMAIDKQDSRDSLRLELQHQRERLQNLKECFKVSGLINSTLQLEEVLERIMTTCRTILKAESCSLMLVDEATQELVFEVAQGPVAHKITTGFRLKKGEGIAGHVFQSGAPLLIEDAYKDPRFHRDFDLKTGYRTRSILCVPLKIKDRIIGVSQVINKLDGTPFASEDEETLTLLCTHAAIAIENARMHHALLRKQQIESDLAFASRIQLSFLPQEVPQIQGFHFRAHYQAAMEVGGDFYDFIPLEEGRWGILIGDVSGKGVASALYMARLTSDFRLHAIRHRDPSRVMEKMNDLLCERSQRGMFVTVLYMVLDAAQHTITCVNAGHLPPLIWNPARNHFHALREAGGLPLGILPGQNYPSFDVCLCRGDCLLLSTDGLIEAKDPAGEMFGWNRLEQALRQAETHVEGVYCRLMETMQAFVQGCPQCDDTTIVLLGIEES